MFNLSADKTFAKNILIFLPAFITLLFFSYQWRNFQLDDALIYLRYIKNFQDGLGLVYNPGEKFNGLTSPLFTYVMALGSLFFNNLQILTISISSVFLFFASCFSAKIFSESSFFQGLTALSIVGFGYFYSTFGMETPLFLMLISLSIYSYQKEKDYFVVFLAMLIITRSEGIFLALPMALHYLITKHRLPDLRYVVFAFLIFISPYIFNFLYYGHPLPVTGSAKIGQGQSGLWGESWIFFDVGYLVNWVFSGSSVAAYSFFSFAIVGFFFLNSVVIKIISTIFMLGLVFFYGGLNIPNYHWYYAPFFLFSVCFVVKLFEYVCNFAFKNKLAKPLLGLLFIFLLVIYILLAYFVGPQSRGRFEPYANIGLWLKENTEPSSSVAMVEIGTVGWYADRYIVDILGLTNKFNADYVAQRDLVSWLLHYQPDYILMHDPAWPHERGGEFMRSNGFYSEVKEFNFPGYSLVAKKKSVSSGSINEFIRAFHKGNWLLEKLQESSDLASTHINYKFGRLFVHAPASLSADASLKFKELEFQFGIDVGAEGKHSDICFEIQGMNGQGQVIYFSRCIEAGAEEEEMRGSGVIDLSGVNIGDLEFNISCKTSCDYAWTYWEKVLLK